MGAVVLIEHVEKKIVLVRGHKAMLDADLAKLYGVTTFNLNKAVKRNMDRFPSDFMFRLTAEEAQILIFQFGISRSGGWGGRRHSPHVFTEQGVAMLSSVLKSKRAAQANIAIMRAFVRLREMIASHKDLAHRLNELEKKYDRQFKIVFDAIRELMTPSKAPIRRIGFHSK
jgi:hypothetical protein